MTDEEVAELPPPERALWERVCGHKHRHENASRARAHAHRLRESKGDVVTPYRCPFCRNWHVGHVPSMRTVERIALMIRGIPL